MGSKPLSNYPLSRVTVTGTGTRPDGFHKMNNRSVNDHDLDSIGESGSDVELNLRNKAERGTSDWNGEGIQVKTDVDLRIEEVRNGIEREVKRTQERSVLG